MTPDFPAEVEQAAAGGGRRARGCPTSTAPTSRSSRSTRAASLDLDQALHIERDGDGYVVHYAIADVAAFVDAGRPGRRRGAPARRDALRRRLQGPAAPEGDLRGRRLAAARPGPPGAAVDDPGRRDRRGHRRRRSSGRGCGRPRQLDYDERAAGDRRRHRRRVAACCSRRSASCGCAREAARGGVSLPLPEQEIDVDGRPLAPGVPLAAPGRGVERPDLAADRLRRRVAHGLRPGRAAAHPAAAGPARRAATAPHRPRAGHRLAGRAALPRLHPLARPRPGRATPRWSWPAPGCCAAAGTSASTARCPAEPQHAALASEYAHVTAPLRRLGDRYAGEVCVALCAGTDVPDWVLEKLHELPETLPESSRRANQYERAIVDLGSRSRRRGSGSRRSGLRRPRPPVRRR